MCLIRELIRNGATLLLLGMRTLLVHGMPDRLVKIIGLSAPDGGLPI